MTSMKLEDRLLYQFNGKSTSLPQTLTLDHVSAATRLLEKRRQMFEVQEALSAQKEEFNRREDAFRRREDGLRSKDLVLQKSLIKFNKFLQVKFSSLYSLNIGTIKFRRRLTSTMDSVNHRL